MKTSKNSNRRWQCLFLVVAVLCPMIFPGSTLGQEAQEPISTEPVKVGFQSWSLFLVCNPTWLLTENREQLLNLYQQFGAFSMAIGPRDLAVWFWKSRPKANTPLADYVDVDRSSQYCAKFKLLPSESPHVLVTTTDPDLGARVGNYVVLRLSNATSSDVTIFLTKLTDQLVVEGLNQAALDSEEYWRKWQRSFDAVRRTAAGFVKKVQLTVDTKFFKLEIEGGS